MSAKQRIRTRYIPTSTFSIDEDTKYYTFIGKILKIAKTGIQVTNGYTEGKLWIDIDNFSDTHHTVIEEEFTEGQDIKLTVALNTYVNKNREFSLKIILLDIEQIPENELDKEWLKNSLRPEFEVSIKLIDNIKTDVPGLRIVRGIRLDMYNDEFEEITFRYYNKAITELKTGIYKVKFTISNTSKIIVDSGEVYTEEEVYKLLVDGSEVERKAKVFIPCLEVKELLMQVD